MNFEHYTEISEISGRNRRKLNELVEDCGIIYDKSLPDLIDSTEDKSVICAFEDDEICGFATLEADDFCITIDELYVDSVHRKHGVGKALMEQAKEYAKQKGIPKLELAVGIDNLKARHLYEKLGFVYARQNRNKVVMRSFADEKVMQTAQVLFEMSKNIASQTDMDIGKNKTGIDKNKFEKIDLNLLAHTNQLLSDCEANPEIDIIKKIQTGHVSEDEKKSFSDVFSLEESLRKQVALSAEAFECLERQDEVCKNIENFGATVL